MLLRNTFNSSKTKKVSKNHKFSKTHILSKTLQNSLLLFSRTLNGVMTSNLLNFLKSDHKVTKRTLMPEDALKYHRWLLNSKKSKKCSKTRLTPKMPKIVEKHILPKSHKTQIRSKSRNWAKIGHRQPTSSASGQDVAHPRSRKLASLKKN